MEFKISSSYEARFLIYERALKELPGSYKIWFRYLSERKIYSKEKANEKDYEQMNDCFERCLITLQKVIIKFYFFI